MLSLRLPKSCIRPSIVSLEGVSRQSEHRRNLANTVKGLPIDWFYQHLSIKKNYEKYQQNLSLKFTDHRIVSV